MTLRTRIALDIDWDKIGHQSALAATKHQDVMEHIQKAIDLFKIGEKLVEDQEFNDAIEKYKKASDEISDFEIYGLESLFWSRISSIAYAVLFDTKLALQAYQRLIRFEQDPVKLTATYNCITTIYLTANDIQAAHQYSDLSMNVAQTIKDDKLRIELLGGAIFNKSQAYCLENDYINATKFVNQAFEMFKEIGHLGGEGKCLSQLGIIASCSQRYSEALKLLNEALRIFIKIDDPEEIAETKKLLSVPLVANQDYNQAIKELKEAAAINRKLGQLELASHALQFVAKIELEYKKEK